jgi:glycosyltransferase involved in cell wall biosynthesis
LLRILHFLDTIDRGGTETLLYDVCARSKEYGLDMMVVTSKGGELLDSFRMAGVECVVLSRRWKLDPRLILELRRLIRDRDIDIVHTHQAVDAFHAFVATIGLSVFRVLSFHGYASSPQTRAALRFLVPRMDANIVVSHSFLQLLRRVEGYRERDSFTVVHNGVDPMRLSPGHTDLRKELGIAPTTLLFGMVGNFNRWKDQATICRGLAHVFAALPSSHFVFVGDDIGKDGHEIETCKRICSDEGVADRVHFLGRRSDIGGILRSLDCAVLSSSKDSFGLAVVEAWMVGVPILISDIPPFLEISEHGRFARLFRAGDPGDFAVRLLDLAAHLETEKLKANQTMEWALKRFGIAMHMEVLGGLYRSMVS